MNANLTRWQAVVAQMTYFICQVDEFEEIEEEKNTNTVRFAQTLRNQFARDILYMQVVSKLEYVALFECP